MKLFDEALEICVQICEKIAINLSKVGSSFTPTTIDYKKLSNLIEGYNDTNAYIRTIVKMQDKCDYNTALKEISTKKARMPAKDCKAYEILSNLG